MSNSLQISRGMSGPIGGADMFCLVMRYKSLHIRIGFESLEFVNKRDMLRCYLNTQSVDINVEMMSYLC